MYVNFLSASNSVFTIIKKTSIKNFNTSQTVQTASSYTVLIYFNTFVSRMLLALHVTSLQVMQCWPDGGQVTETCSHQGKNEIK